MGVQIFILSKFFSSYAVRELLELRFLFAHFAKIAIKMQMCNSIASIFGTDEEHVTVDSHTMFVVNLRNIQGVMTFIHVKKIKFLSRLQGKPSIKIT